MLKPKSNLYGFMFHGPMVRSELRAFKREPGVYVVGCACGKDSYDLQIGETAEIQGFFLTQFARKRSCKCPSGSRGAVCYYAFYCPVGGKHDRNALLAKILKRSGRP